MSEPKARAFGARHGRGRQLQARMPEDLHIADYGLDLHTHVVEVEGQVDLCSAPELKERTWRVLDEGKTRVVIDLSRVTSWIRRGSAC